MLPELNEVHDDIDSTISVAIIRKPIAEVMAETFDDETVERYKLDIVRHIGGSISSTYIPPECHHDHDCCGCVQRIETELTPIFAGQWTHVVREMFYIT